MKHINILFVDDQESFRFLLSREFKKVENVTFKAFKFSQDFMKELDSILTEVIPDIIIIDINLVGSMQPNGIELFNQLKNIKIKNKDAETNQEIDIEKNQCILKGRAIGFYSTSANEIDVAKDLGADFYILKSFPAKEVVIKLLANLEGHKNKEIGFKLYQ
jgi:DNA-binding NarL/FixJ family response regulator